MDNLNSCRRLIARPRAALAVVFVAGSLGAVRPVRADNPPIYLFQIDASAVPGGQFAPGSVALDGSNNLYVIEGNLSSVLRFDRNGNNLTKRGAHGSGTGQPNFPDGIAVDSNNIVYVLDNLNKR